MTQHDAETNGQESSPETFAGNLLRLSRALAIAEIERFYRNTEVIAFETSEVSDAAQS